MAFGNAKNPAHRKSYSNERNLFFSLRVRTQRLALGLKQSDLGEKVGMTPAQISELEGGRFVSDATRVSEIARALETTPDYLFGFKDDP